MKKNIRLYVSSLIVMSFLGCGGGGGGDPGGVLPGAGDPGSGIPGGGSPGGGTSTSKVSGGTLTLTNAPASTGGTFVSDNIGGGNVTVDPMLVGWIEGGPPVSNVLHSESLEVGFVSSGSFISVAFHSQDLNISTGSLDAFAWACEVGVDCSGVTLNQTTGTVTFSNTVLMGKVLLSGTVAPAAITLNGILKFTPASGGVVDTTPPTVVSVSPANAATNVATSSMITATFSEPMLPSSINATSFVVTGVTGLVTYSGSTAIFTPASALAADTTYNVMITGVQDSVGNALAADYVWSFTTGSTSAIPDAKGNNSALLSGAVIGSGTEAVGDLRKLLAVTVLGTSDPALSIGDVYAMRSDTSSDYAYIAMPVTNTGSSTLCLVKLDGLTYRNTAGTSLLSKSAFVYGSVGNLSVGTFTNTCLAPGETGMMRDINAGLYAAVAKMEFSFVTSSGFSVSAPVASVIPQSYTISTNNLDITVKNIGSGTAQITGPAYWYLLDDGMLPLFWGTTSGASGTMPASAVLTLSGLEFYSGSGSKLLVFTEFADSVPVASAMLAASALSSVGDLECPASLATDELALCKNESRNRQLEVLELSVQ